MYRYLIGWIIHFGIIELLSIILVLVNVFTFALYVLDKRKAIKGKWRISEQALLFFALAFGGIGAICGICLARHKTRKWKFRVAAAIGLVVTLVSVIHIAHSLTLDRVIRYVEVEFRSENWSAELNGYRIAFMTDMHTITDEAMREVAVELNRRDLNLLVLGGDFSMRDDHYRGTIREIAQITATDGIFGVEGNHDDHIRVFGAMEQYGIMPLDNSGLHIREGFFLAGIHDMWNRSPNIAEAAADAYDSDFVLLISHNPDVTMVQPTTGLDLILAGHTHGGQITFFGIPLYLLCGSITSYGMRFANGFAYSADGVPVFTSSGVGSYYNVPRVFARPEIVIITMYHAASPRVSETPASRMNAKGVKSGWTES